MNIIKIIRLKIVKDASLLRKVAKPQISQTDRQYWTFSAQRVYTNDSLLYSGISREERSNGLHVEYKTRKGS